MAKITSTVAIPKRFRNASLSVILDDIYPDHGRPEHVTPLMKKVREALQLEVETEADELIRLRRENEMLRAKLEMFERAHQVAAGVKTTVGTGTSQNPYIFAGGGGGGGGSTISAASSTMPIHTTGEIKITGLWDHDHMHSTTVSSSYDELAKKIKAIEASLAQQPGNADEYYIHDGEGA